jgi:hypothetical protein
MNSPHQSFALKSDFCEYLMEDTANLHEPGINGKLFSCLIDWCMLRPDTCFPSSRKTKIKIFQKWKIGLDG